MTNQFAYSKTYALGCGYSVTFTLSCGQFGAEWEPDLPSRGPRRKILPAYRAARDDFIGSLDTPIVLVEI